jgi:hypothetical protein
LGCQLALWLTLLFLAAPACLLLQGLNWGNGFVTDKALIAQWGITDANPFFQALMERPYLNRVVISPHLYGPSVSHRKDFYKVGPGGGGLGHTVALEQTAAPP